MHLFMQFLYSLIIFGIVFAIGYFLSFYWLFKNVSKEGGATDTKTTSSQPIGLKTEETTPAAPKPQPVAASAVASNEVKSEATPKATEPATGDQPKAEKAVSKPKAKAAPKPKAKAKAAPKPDKAEKVAVVAPISDEDKDAKIAAIAALEVSDDDKPVTLSAARGGNADNLKRVKGIGPVNEKRLNDLGIYHFDQIAVWGDREIAWMDGYLSFKGRIVRENWVSQASDLAQGVETEFSKRVDKGQVDSSK